MSRRPISLQRVLDARSVAAALAGYPAPQASIDAFPVEKRDDLGAAVDFLSRYPAALGDVCETLLDLAADFAQGPTLAAADEKLPLVDYAAVSLVVLHAIWLVMTRGRKTKLSIVRTTASGAREEIELEEWHAAPGAHALARLLELPTGASRVETPDDT